jgi:hypothetical protein
MQYSTTRRLTLEAIIDRSVIRGTLTTSSGDRCDFHGWLELNTAIEAALSGSSSRQQPSPPGPSSPQQPERSNP